MFYNVYLNFNAHSIFSCTTCLQSKTCGWCQLDFTCTGQNSSCTTGEWLNVRPAYPFMVCVDILYR